MARNTLPSQGFRRGIKRGSVRGEQGHHARPGRVNGAHHRHESGAGRVQHHRRRRDRELHGERRGPDPGRRKSPGLHRRDGRWRERLRQRRRRPGDHARLLRHLVPPHCQNEAPILSELEGQYDGLSMVMVGIDGENNQEKVRQLVKRYSIQSPAVYEPSLGPEYGVSGYPTTDVLDKSNKVIGTHSGEAPRKVYEGRIEKALGSGG